MSHHLHIYFSVHTDKNTKQNTIQGLELPKLWMRNYKVLDSCKHEYRTYLQYSYTWKVSSVFTCSAISIGKLEQQNEEAEALTALSSHWRLSVRQPSTPPVSVTKPAQISIEIQIYSWKKLCLKMSSARWRPFCLGLNMSKENVSLCDLLNVLYATSVKPKSIPVFFTRNQMIPVRGNRIHNTYAASVYKVNLFHSTGIHEFGRSHVYDDWFCVIKHRMSLKTGSCHDANCGVNGRNVCCSNDNLRFQFSVIAPGLYTHHSLLSS